MQKKQMKKALITGITGQDGSYLAEFLLGKGYQVHGIVRRSSSFNTGRIEHLYIDPHSPSANLFLHYGDLVDGTGLREMVPRSVTPHHTPQPSAVSTGVAFRLLIANINQLPRSIALGAANWPVV